jgi:leucyl aminopeptidase
MKVTFTAPELPEQGVIVVGVLEDRTLTPSARKLNEALGGLLDRAMASGRFQGKKDQVLSLVAPGEGTLDRVVLLGLGKVAELNEVVADGVFFSRDLISEPGNIVYPETLAEAAQGLEQLGVEVEVLGEKEMKKLGMGALLGVGQGSARESKLVVMQWRGASGKSEGKGRKKSDSAPVAFIGKGVTFDTGGISIKPSAGMEEMKYDMAGAGTVVGLMKALAGRKAKVDAVGVIGCVENMPSGTAQRPGDIVTSMSGQTIEVLNTDAEGRLVLADALWYTQDRFKPRFMINLATLTGAIVIALGHHKAGLFSNNDELAERIIAAGLAVDEPAWRMPLGPEYDKALKSDAADMKNIGNRAAGSVTAAQFLQRFVNEVPWAHIDIAGVAWAKEARDVVPKGASGYGVRLLNQLVAEQLRERLTPANGRGRR